MRLIIVIFMFWTLAGKWRKSAAQGNNIISFCTLRICSLPTLTHEIRIQIEPTHCSDQPSSSLGVPERLNLNFTCANRDDHTCTRVLNILQTCPTLIQIQSTDNSICQYCPNTTINRTTTTRSPSTPDTDCPTRPSNIATSIRPSNITTSIRPSNIPISITPSNIPTSIMPTTKNTDPSPRISEAINERDSLKVIVIALGVLVSILVILLIAVTSGWVWTCWTMKQNKATTPEHVRTIQNTAYGVIGPVGNSEREGQTSSGHQQRQTENDQTMNEERGVDHGEEHDYHVLEGPGENTHPQQNRELEMREVRESGEEHAYHVLEGPGSDSASREIRVRGVGGAMDYEIPLPLKK